VRVAYDRTGRGPVLVLLHPLGADRRVWDPIVERLGDRRELIAVDLPGFGESQPLAATPTPAALAEAVGTLLAEIGVIRPHVAGISLGGWVSLELALRGSVASTVAVAPAGMWSRPLMPKPRLVRRLVRPVVPALAALARTSAGRRLMLAGTAAHPERVPAGQAAHLVTAWANAPGFDEVNACMRAGRFEGLERIASPVTLVWPEHDRLVKRPRSLPGSVRSVSLADAGHVPVWDAPDELAALLLRATAEG
jgi:pimeloyl-ACP methyl ester carboxylesterase